MRIRSLLIAAAALLLAPAAARAQTGLPVVASFSILADMAQNVGGDLAAVRALVGPDADTHVYEPTPSDVRAVAGAKLVIVNGLGFEGWTQRLIASAGFKGALVTAAKGVATQSMVDEGARIADPHAWQDLQRGMQYVRNIADGFAAADPAHAAQYRANEAAYLARLAELDAWTMAQLAAIPASRRKVITSHDAFGYFGRRYGVTFLAPLGVSTEGEASAKGVAALITQIRRENIRAIFIENMSDPRLLRVLADEGGAIIGDELYADALSRADGPAATYLELFRRNVAALTAAMGRQ